jgi:hypothetical protein
MCKEKIIQSPESRNAILEFFGFLVCFTNLGGAGFNMGEASRA